MDSLFDFSLSEYIDDTIIVIENNKIINPFTRTYDLETEETLKRQRYNGLQQLKRTIKEKSNHS